MLICHCFPSCIHFHLPVLLDVSGCNVCHQCINCMQCPLQLFFFNIFHDDPPLWHQKMRCCNATIARMSHAIPPLSNISFFDIVMPPAAMCHLATLPSAMAHFWYCNASICSISFFFVFCNTSPLWSLTCWYHDTPPAATSHVLVSSSFFCNALPLLIFHFLTLRRPPTATCHTTMPPFVMSHFWLVDASLCIFSFFCVFCNTPPLRHLIFWHLMWCPLMYPVKMGQKFWRKLLFFW